MQPYETLKHTTWECKYQVVFIPKCRRKTLYVQLRRDLAAVFRGLAEPQECQSGRGTLMPDHLHEQVRGRSGKDGGAVGIRTPDPHNAIVVLYQLSYDPIQRP
jgi:hypothetical protein